MAIGPRTMAVTVKFAAMQITTDPDFQGIDASHPWAGQFDVLRYADGAVTFLPKEFFVDWRDLPPSFGFCEIAKSSGFGVGTKVKYDHDRHRLIVGRYVSGGQRVRIVLNAQHNMNVISTYMFTSAPPTNVVAEIPQAGNTTFENDIWIGDEAMILGGATIANGCILAARALVTQGQKLEPYGIYVGAPARLTRLRFSEKIVELLLISKWWTQPRKWIEENAKFFSAELSMDEGRSIELLKELIRNVPK